MIPPLLLIDDDDLLQPSLALNLETAGDRVSIAASAEVAGIILVTARRRELDQVVGLELGANEYVVKPFDPDVLLARCKAVPRRSQPSKPRLAAPAPVTGDDLAIAPLAHRVAVGDKVVELPPHAI